MPKDQLGDIQELLEGLTQVTAGLPVRVEELNKVLEELIERRNINLDDSIWDPDWLLQAEIQVGAVLSVSVEAEFELERTIEKWHVAESIAREFLDGVIQEVLDSGSEPIGTKQILDQLQAGHGTARICQMEMLHCRIPGRSQSAGQNVQLSPEANIPFSVRNGELAIDFAPMLNIRNAGGKPEFPTLSNTADEITVPLTRFKAQNSFPVTFESARSQHPTTIKLTFKPRTKKPDVNNAA